MISIDTAILGAGVILSLVLGVLSVVICLHQFKLQMKRAKARLKFLGGIAMDRNTPMK